MRFDPGDLIARQFIFDDDLRPRRHAPYLRRELLVIELQSVGDDGQVFGLYLIAKKQKRVRRFVVDHYSSIAIEYPASRRQNGRALNSVSLSGLTINVRILHLQFPEPRDQEDKNRDREVFEDSNLPGGFFRVVARERV